MRCIHSLAILPSLIVILCVSCGPSTPGATTEPQPAPAADGAQATEASPDMTPPSDEEVAMAFTLAKAGDWDKLLPLIEHKPGLAKRASSADYLRTILHYVAASNRKDIAELLVKNGANVNALDHDRRTPLHVAAESGQKDIVELLLSNDADFKLKDITDATPLYLAAYNCHMDTINALVAKAATLGNPALDNAMLGKYEVMDFLVQSDRSLLNQGDDTSRSSPLFWSVIMDQSFMTRRLIDLSANVNAVNARGERPLHWAAIRGRTEMAEFLLKGRADINAQDDHRRTPLMDAVMNGQAEFAQLLIDRGADVTLADRDGSTALHMAAQAGDKEIAAMLVKAGADVNAADQDGKTPLQVAVEHNNREIEDLLRASGAK